MTIVVILDPNHKSHQLQKSYLSLVEHHDAVTVEHSLQPVGDGQRGAVLKGRADGLLNQGVCLSVHSGSGLIQDQNLREGIGCRTHR